MSDQPYDFTRQHWTPTRKDDVVEGIRRGRIDKAKFMVDNAMSEEELAEWTRDAELGRSAHRRGPAYQHRRRNA